MVLARLVYELTKKFPKDEQYGLTSQMRRAVVSIPSNIAEGRRRSGDKECRHFFYISFGSGGELETQLELSCQFGYVQSNDALFIKTNDCLLEVMRMLNKMIQ